MHSNQYDYANWKSLAGFSVVPGTLTFKSVFPPVVIGYVCMCVYSKIPWQQQAELCDRENKHCFVQQGTGTSKKWQGRTVSRPKYPAVILNCPARALTLTIVCDVVGFVCECVCKWISLLLLFLPFYAQTTQDSQDDWQLIFMVSEPLVKTFNRQPHKTLFKAWSGRSGRIYRIFYYHIMHRPGHQALLNICRSP